MAEIMAFPHRFFVSDTCPFERYDAFVIALLLSTMIACGAEMTILTVILALSRAPPKWFMDTYRVLEAILAKMDPDERNVAFLDACNKYSKTPAGQNEAGFRSTVGMGRCEEVYNHYIKMEVKRLEAKEKGKEGKKSELLEGIDVSEGNLGTWYRQFVLQAHQT